MFRAKSNNNEFMEDLVRKSDAAVKGYENYLLDKITSKDLAVIMKKLHEVLKLYKKTNES